MFSGSNRNTDCFVINTITPSFKSRIITMSVRLQQVRILLLYIINNIIIIIIIDSGYIMGNPILWWFPEKVRNSCKRLTAAMYGNEISKKNSKYWFKMALWFLIAPKGHVIICVNLCVIILYI